MKKSSRGIACFLSAALLLSSVPGVALRAQADEETIVISTAEDFEAFSRKCNSEIFSRGKTVRLEADISLAGREFYPVPVFAGTFEGNGHTISGVYIRQTGSNLGLFRYVEEEAVVRDLNVIGNLKPEGSRKKIGGIAGTNRGTIRGCTFSGTGEALESLGGIAGINEESGVIEECRNVAELVGNRKIGGIAGENVGRILSSHNEGEINASAEGVEEDSDGMSNISMDRETIEETVIREKINDVGGIAGLSSGTIRQCGNSGQIGYGRAGYNVGGIVGRQNGVLMLCENEGTVKGRKDVGGIAGQLEPLLTILYGEDTFDRINDQIDRLSDTTDSMTDKLWNTTDASVGNLDRVDEIMKEIKNITRDKKDERRIRRDDFGDQADRQLDEIDEILANMEFDLGSRTAQSAAGRVENNIKKSKELLGSLGDDFIPDEDDEGLSGLQYLLETLTELQGCAEDISSDTELMITSGIDGVVDGVRDFEDDLDSLRIASKELLDMTRDYKDQLIDDVDDLDSDVTGQLDQLYDELDSLSDNLKSGKDQLRGEKERLDTQLDEMQDIIVDGKNRVNTERDKFEDDDEPLFEDISEDATDLSNGMIVGCSNKGDVFSDYQAGGVVGTIGVEIGLDPEEDIETYGDKSLYMNRYARASVRECRNEGDITAQKDYAGGIVGTAKLGVLAANQNYGDIISEDGDYVGGIAGSSQSAVNGSYVMCEVSGNDYTGGVVGLGKNIRNNYAMVNVVSDGGEWQGSIAGDRDEEGEVTDNIYVDDGLGAVDGITFLGEAAGITYEELLQKEDLPSEFHSLTVTFLADDQVVEQVICGYGSALQAEDMPEIPKKEGFFEHWEQVDLSDIRRNYKVNAVYVPWTTTIACSDEPRPFLLAEGNYYNNAQLSVREVDEAEWREEGISAPTGHSIQKVYAYEVKDPENPDPSGAAKLHVLAKGTKRVGIVKDGRIQTIEAVKDGDYLEFDADAAGQIVLMGVGPVWDAAIGVILMAAVLFVVIKSNCLAGLRRYWAGRKKK